MLFIKKLNLAVRQKRVDGVNEKQFNMPRLNEVKNNGQVKHV